MPDEFGRRVGDPENRTVAWKLIDTDPATGEDVWAEIVALEPDSIGGGGGGPSTTVALDAPTLAALETIQVGNFPASWALDAGTLAALETISVANFPAVQPVNDNGGSLTVDGTFWQATQPVSGPLTDAQLRAASVPISDGGGSLTVDGTFWQATQPVSGPLTDAQLRAVAVPVSGTFWQATQPVSGTFWQATQPVSGPLTDAQLRAVAVPVSGTFWQATQPVSGTFWQATQPVSLAASVNVEGDTASDAPLTNNPVTTGGRASDAAPTKMSADADVVTDWRDRRGATIVRDREDMNRTQKAYKFRSTAAAVADTLLSVVPQTNFVDAAGATTFAVAANKILRLTHIIVALRTTTAANPWGRAMLRVNPAGAAVIGSPIVATVAVGGSAAVAGNTATAYLNLDEELELTGSNQFGISFENNVNTNVTDITVLGYEYDN